MKRIIFCLFVALTTFGLSTLIMFRYDFEFSKQVFSADSKKITETNVWKKPVGTGFGRDFLTEQTNEPTGSGFATATRGKNEPVYEPKLHKPTCTDKKILPVWKVLKEDDEFKEFSKDFFQKADCSKMFDVQRVDLNGDGKNEYIFWGNNGNLCGATGDCKLWIYERKNGNYRKLLRAYAHNDRVEKWFELSKRKSKGYRNLVLKGSYSGYETTVYFYEFNGKIYKENKCLFEDYSLNEKKPSVQTCEEAWKR